MIHLYNSLSKQKIAFTPLHADEVGLYSCGPTVYHYAHIGNLRSYIFQDVLKRTLRANGYKVRHVMNITDVGHLTDDGDDGEDKMEKGSAREGKTAWDVAQFYTDAFYADIAQLNIIEPTIWSKATDHIPEQIAMVEKLTEKGHTYQTEDGIYFDTTSIDDYGKLVDVDKQELQAGVRVDMGGKKNPHDFALWKFTRAGETRQMEWDAFMRKGFPGWHIECSAMAQKYLGDQFDIHCGGIDHKPVHHTNEIAQTEASTGKKPSVQVWMHNEFLVLQGEEKMSKSGDNFMTLSKITEDGIPPLAYRYYLLQAHYRKQLAYSTEALQGAAQGLKTLKRLVAAIPDRSPGDLTVTEAFMQAVNDDLNTPEALAVLFTALKRGSVSKEQVMQFDKILGLDLLKQSIVNIPDDVQVLVDKRAAARTKKDFALSDALRDEIATHGFSVKDGSNGQEITPA
ncbi:MAG: cysteine--tRNA ligase [Candidatus Magasanikbacteria bacterium]|nr:cysteine--tRNA ligase [Candidatus Magasanikbacteria bacterium]